MKNCFILSHVVVRAAISVALASKRYMEQYINRKDSRYYSTSPAYNK